MPVQTDFSQFDGDASTKIRKAAAWHTEAALIEGALAIKPDSKVHDPFPHSIAFREHTQAAATLRDMAAMLADCQRAADSSS